MSEKKMCIASLATGSFYVQFKINCGVAHWFDEMCMSDRNECSSVV